MAVLWGVGALKLDIVDPEPRVANEFASGENFIVTLGNGQGRIRVWRRPDLDAAAGARCAAAIEEAIERLTHLTRVIVLDLSDAPLPGPKTEQRLGAMLALCERARVALAVIVGDDAVKALKLRRLLIANAPKHGRSVRDLLEAELWLNQRRG